MLQKSSTEHVFGDFVKTSFWSLPGLRLRSKLLFLTPHDDADLSGSLSDDFGKNHFSTKILHFARVTFQFSVQGLAARAVSADMTAFLERSQKKLVWPRAVLAAVAKKPLKNRLEDLNATLAVGPSFFDNRPATGECFAPFSDRSRKNLVAARAVLAAVPKKPLKNRREGSE